MTNSADKKVHVVNFLSVFCNLNTSMKIHLENIDGCECRANFLVPLST